jgi:hypothetical protein
MDNEIRWGQAAYNAMQLYEAATTKKVDLRATLGFSRNPLMPLEGEDKVNRDTQALIDAARYEYRKFFDMRRTAAFNMTQMRKELQDLLAD